MKRIVTVITVLAAATLLNGCTKCSQNPMTETPPPVVEPVQPPPTEMPAGDAPAMEAMPGDTTGMPSGH